MATISFEQFMKQGGATDSNQVTSLGVNGMAPSTQPQTGEGYLGGLKQDLNTRVDRVGNILNRKDTPTLRKGVQVFGQGAGLAANAIEKTAEKIPGVKQAFEGIGKGINWLATSELSPIKHLGDKIGESKTLQELTQIYDTDEDFKDTVDAVANIARLGGDVQMIVDGGVFAKNVTNKLKDLTLPPGGTGELLSSAGGKLKQAGENAYSVGVGMEEPTKIALQSYEATQPSLFGRVKNMFTGGKSELADSVKKPITEANTAARKGLVGTEWQLGVQAKQVANDLWTKNIQPALKSTKEKVSMPTFLKELKEKIISETPDLNRRNTLLDGFDKFAADYKKVSNFGVEKLQNYKEGWADFVPEATYKGKPIAGALNEIRNLAAQKARSIIYEKLGPGIQEAYIDYGNLQSIKKAGIKSVDQLRSKGVTRQVWEFILDKAVTPVATIGGQILYKTGEGLEFLGKPGAKKVKDIVSPHQTEAISTSTTSTPKTINIEETIPKTPKKSSLKDQGEIPPTNIHPKLQSLYESAPHAKIHIDTLADTLATKHGGSVAKVDLKHPTSALRKLETEKGGDVSKINDIARNTIVVPKGKFDIAKNDLFDAEGAHNPKHILPHEDALGYSGGKVNIKTPNGHIAEIQINTPEMVYAKEPTLVAKKVLGEEVYQKLKLKYDKKGLKGGLGHVFYEQFRNLPFSEKVAGRLHPIAKKSIDYYSNF